MSRTAIRRLALAVAGTVLLAACRSGGHPTHATSSRPFAAYRQCLEQHGLPPRPPGSTRDTSNPANAAAFQAARQACATLRPPGGLRGAGINSDARAAFRRCMTDQGVTLPAPGVGGPKTGATSAPRGGMLRGLDRNDPAVSKALAACRSVLVAPPTTTSTGPH